MAALNTLYPPAALPFFALFAALPAILWWALPAAMIAAALWRRRPARWSWPILALLAISGQSIPLVVAGNPTLWVVALGLWAPLVGWTGALILLKPTVAPLALLGARHRSWWVAAAALAAVSVPFAGMWVEWARVLLDTRTSGPAGITYSLVQLPALLIPVVAWAGWRQPTLRISLTSARASRATG